MSDAPEQVWAAVGKGPKGVFLGTIWSESRETEVSYTRTDHVQTLIAEAVAVAYDDAAKVGSIWSDDYFAVEDYNAENMISKPIRTRTPADAQEALAARDKRVRDEALREIRDRADEMQDAAHQIHKDGGSALALLVLSFCELIDADAQEALEARDKRVRDEALREALCIIGGFDEASDCPHCTDVTAINEAVTALIDAND